MTRPTDELPAVGDAPAAGDVAATGDVAAAGDAPAVAASAPSVSEKWDTGMIGFWEAIFAVSLIVVWMMNTVGHSGPPTQRWVISGFYAAMAVWYVVLGRSVVRAHHSGRRGFVFQSVLLALFLAATFVNNSTSFLLIALCPLLYMSIPAPWAQRSIWLYGFGPAAIYLAKTGDVATTVTVLGPIGLVSVGISVALARTTMRTEQLSEDRAELIRQLELSRAEVSRLSREAGVAEERQRLAGDIHDTVAQGLSSVVMLVEAADVALTKNPAKARQHLALAARTARENLDEARAIVGALTPVPLTGASLEDALRRLTDRFARENEMAASFTVEGTTRALPTGAEVVLLRVAQEALTNVRKHALAHSVRVRLSITPDRVAVDIRDDGQGFDPTALHAGYGLGAMRARVEQIGGQLVVRSAPLDGTTVHTEIDI